MRGTLRYPGFMKAWNILVQLGLTDDQELIKEGIYAEWVANRNNLDPAKPLLQQVADKLGIAADNEALQKVSWLGIFNNEPIRIKEATSANILLDVLEDKWALAPGDKDLIVMRHEIEYIHRSGNTTKLVSNMTLTGTDQKYSAMAKTVGLPMAILTKLVLTGKVTPPAGVHIPNMPQVYKPVLSELEEHGVVFNEIVS